MPHSWVNDLKQMDIWFAQMSPWLCSHGSAVDLQWLWLACGLSKKGLSEGPIWRRRARQFYLWFGALSLSVSLLPSSSFCFKSHRFCLLMVSLFKAVSVSSSGLGVIHAKRRRNKYLEDCALMVVRVSFGVTRNEHNRSYSVISTCVLRGGCVLVHHWKMLLAPAVRRRVAIKKLSRS